MECRWSWNANPLRLRVCEALPPPPPWHSAYVEALKAHGPYVVGLVVMIIAVIRAIRQQLGKGRRLRAQTMFAEWDATAPNRLQRESVAAVFHEDDRKQFLALAAIMRQVSLWFTVHALAVALLNWRIETPWKGVADCMNEVRHTLILPGSQQLVLTANGRCPHSSHLRTSSTPGQRRSWRLGRLRVATYTTCSLRSERSASYGRRCGSRSSSRRSSCWSKPRAPSLQWIAL